MRKRYGCATDYLAYVVLFVVYFIIIGKLIGVLLPNLQSETALVALNLSSAVLSFLTVALIRNHKRIIALVYTKAIDEEYKPMTNQPSTPEQAAVQVSVNPQQIAFIEGKIRTEKQFQGGANSFFWIAGLSLVNSIILLVGGSWSFFIGLGTTQFIDGVSIAIAKDIGANGITLLRIIAFAMDVGIAAVFAVFGILARKRHKWAFIIGMVLYALDGHIFLIVPDFLSIGFHLLILYWLYLGLKALTKLRGIEQVAAA